MPQRETRFSVNAAPEELWRFIRDFESLCTCVPGVERINLIDERTADLTVREKVGVIPMVLTLRATIESEDPPRRLRATARAQHLTMAIEVTLEPGASGTELRGLFDVTGTGQLKPIVDRLFEKRADERTRQFAQCLELRFAGQAGEAATVTAADGVTARMPASSGKVPARVSAAVRGWMSRLWRRLRSATGL
jgi:carbon monoxide dehydrogenase subunit G